MKILNQLDLGMNQIQVSYETLVEVMQEKLASQLSQIIALEAKIKVYDQELTKALNNASQNKSPQSRKKSVDTDEDGGTF